MVGAHVWMEHPEGPKGIYPSERATQIVGRLRASTLSEALTHSQALLSTTGKVYLFGDPSHLLHQHRNMIKMATETTTAGCYVEELMSFGFGESDTSPLDPTVKPESASGGSDRGDSNADLKSQKHSESSDSEQPGPIMTVIIDNLARLLERVTNSSRNDDCSVAVG